MTNIYSWSTDASKNGKSDNIIDLVENKQFPLTVNNNGRAMMRRVREYLTCMGGSHRGRLIYTFADRSTVPESTTVRIKLAFYFPDYFDDLIVRFQAFTKIDIGSNIGDTKIAVNKLPGKAVYKATREGIRPIGNGDIRSGCVYTIIYRASGNHVGWFLLNPTHDYKAIIDTHYKVPSGMIIHLGTRKLPSGWLWCDGGEYSRWDYPDLFAAIGTTWGAGNGTSTFNVPDLRGVFIRGRDDDHPFASYEADLFKGHTHEMRTDDIRYDISLHEEQPEAPPEPEPEPIKPAPAPALPEAPPPPSPYDPVLDLPSLLRQELMDWLAKNWQYIHLPESNARYVVLREALYAILNKYPYARDYSKSILYWARQYGASTEKFTLKRIYPDKPEVDYYLESYGRTRLEHILATIFRLSRHNDVPTWFQRFPYRRDDSSEFTPLFLSRTPGIHISSTSPIAQFASSRDEFYREHSEFYERLDRLTRGMTIGRRSKRQAANGHSLIITRDNNPFKGKYPDAVYIGDDDPEHDYSSSLHGYGLTSIDYLAVYTHKDEKVQEDWEANDNPYTWLLTRYGDKTPHTVIDQSTNAVYPIYTNVVSYMDSRGLQMNPNTGKLYQLKSDTGGGSQYIFSQQALQQAKHYTENVLGFEGGFSRVFDDRMPGFDYACKLTSGEEIDYPDLGGEDVIITQTSNPFDGKLPRVVNVEHAANLCENILLWNSEAQRAFNQRTDETSEHMWYAMALGGVTWDSPVPAQYPLYTNLMVYVDNEGYAVNPNTGFRMIIAAPDHTMSLIRCTESRQQAIEFTKTIMGYTNGIGYVADPRFQAYAAGLLRYNKRQERKAREAQAIEDEKRRKEQEERDRIERERQEAERQRELAEKRTRFIATLKQRLDHYHEFGTETEGGIESRPVNINVMYAIKA